MLVIFYIVPNTKDNSRDLLNAMFENFFDTYRRRKCLFDYTFSIYR